MTSVSGAVRVTRQEQPQQTLLKACTQGLEAI